MLGKLALLVAAGVIASGAACAGTFDEEVDRNGDGVVTEREFAFAYPDKDESLMTVVDVNGDGRISRREYAAAVDHGLLPEG